MSDKTKQQLKIENNSSFPNNNTGFITPEKLRTFNENVIDSFLENDYTASNDATIADLSGSFNDFTQSYYIDSASFDSRISAVDTSSYVEQTQFDSFATQSDQRLDSIEQFTASIDDDFVSEGELAAATASLINQINTKADQTDFTAYTSSNDSRVSSIENTTSSLETKFDTLASTTSSLNTFTSSAEQQLNSLEQFTASIDDDFVSETELAAATGALENSIATKLDSSSFENYTSSADNRLENIEQTTASLENSVSEINTFTSSADNRLDNIENNTGSYARTDTTNQFQQTQTLEQDLVVQGNLYVSGAEVIISSSELVVGDRIIEVNANKVIGDAGLYAFDAVGDQTGSLIWNPTLDYWLAGLSGSEEKVLVSSDTASIEGSINSLNNLSGSLIQTASNDFSEITLTKVDGTTQVLDTTPRQVVESIKNGNGQTLVKGTPVFASGSVGNSNLVFPASASDASTMPAVYILAQELAPDEEGLGYTHGFINGVNTSLFTAGDEIFVGENGGYTNQRPTGSNLIQKLGVVVRSDNNNGSGVIQIEGVAKLPNIQEGYIWVGDNDGVPQQVATSSIEENTDLSSLNSFTASAEGRLDNIEQTTASLENSVSQLVNATASYLERDGDSVISGSISSGFVPVGVGENEIDNSVMTIDNTGVFTIGQQTATLPFPQMQMWTNTDGGSAYAAIQILDAGSGSARSQLETTTFDSVYGFGTPVSRLRMGSQSGTHPGGGDGNVVFVAPSNTSDVQWYKDTLWTAGTNIRLESGSAEITGSVDIQGTFTASLTEGHILVGDSNDTTTEISTGSFATTQSLNAYTESADNRLNNLENETGSYLREGDEVISGSITSGLIPVATGNHSLDNSVASIDASGVFAVGSIANPLPFPQIQMRTDSDGGSSYAAYQLIDEGSGSATAQLELTTFDGIYGFGNPVNRLRMGSNTGQHPDGNVVFVAPTDTSDVQWYKDALFTQGTNIRLESGNAEITGSVDIQGTFTSSLTEGFVLVGDSNNRTYEVSTGSFGGGGSTDITALNNFTASQEDLNQTFATTGSNTFIGNQTFNQATNFNINADTGSFQIPFLQFDTTKFTINDTSGLDFISQANITFESLSDNIQFLGDATFNNKAIINEVLQLNEVLKLQGQDPLPPGTIGNLAVSGSNLYFYDGAWRQVSLV